MDKDEIISKGKYYLVTYKNHIDNFTQKERNIYFVLLVNLIINIIMYFKTYNEGDVYKSKAFFPFFSDKEYYFSKSDSIMFKFFETYSREELFYYGILPLIIFYIWFYFFKGKK